MLEMAHVYRPRIVDTSFLWPFLRKCDTFDIGGCYSLSINPRGVRQPLPTPR